MTSVTIKYEIIIKIMMPRYIYKCDGYFWLEIQMAVGLTYLCVKLTKFSRLASKIELVMART
jgi:hypothetical protein